MQFITLTCFFALMATSLFANKLYVKTFGKRADKAIVYLHGGPGYNCSTFESTTAQVLSDKGFYVIVYDRRGEGRSADSNAKYNFRQSIEDINEIYKTKKLKKAILIGHSFGGILATKFAESNPEKVSQIILVGAPIALQETFATIINTCKSNYINNNDSMSLAYITMLEQMDKSSLEYSSYSFMHAMQNKLYSPKIMSDEAKILYSKMKTDADAMQYASQMTTEAPTGFWTNEHYTTLNLTSTLEKLVAKKVQIVGMYGKDDGLYSPIQIENAKRILGAGSVQYVENASHSVFIDQQAIFINAVLKWSEL
jgi:proline iminopeptidase